MRLWHYEMIKVLPKQMLLSQWRECIAIKRQWEKGTLKHRLVSYVMNYDKTYFYIYVVKVVDELTLNRKIKINMNLFWEIQRFCAPVPIKEESFNKYYPQHNDRYFKQCYYNLEEKYDRGIISEEEWKPIEKLMYYKIMEDNDE